MKILLNNAPVQTAMARISRRTPFPTPPDADQFGDANPIGIRPRNGYATEDVREKISPACRRDTVIRVGGPAYSCENCRKGRMLTGKPEAPIASKVPNL
jgi:hypothetical protein